MPQTITVTLPDDVRSSLEDVTRREGLPAGEVLTDALKEYLFFRRIRLLRDSMTSQASALGIRTDQDVFDRVS